MCIFPSLVYMCISGLGIFFKPDAPDFSTCNMQLAEISLPSVVLAEIIVQPGERATTRPSLVTMATSRSELSHVSFFDETFSGENVAMSCFRSPGSIFSSLGSIVIFSANVGFTVILHSAVFPLCVVQVMIVFPAFKAVIVQFSILATDSSLESHL